MKTKGWSIGVACSRATQTHWKMYSVSKRYVAMATSQQVVSETRTDWGRADSDKRSTDDPLGSEESGAPAISIKHHEFDPWPRHLNTDASSWSWLCSAASWCSAPAPVPVPASPYYPSGGPNLCCWRCRSTRFGADHATTRHRPKPTPGVPSATKSASSTGRSIAGGKLAPASCSAAWYFGFPWHSWVCEQPRKLRKLRQFRGGEK